MHLVSALFNHQDKNRAEHDRSDRTACKIQSQIAGLLCAFNLPYQGLWRSTSALLSRDSRESTYNFADEDPRSISTLECNHAKREKGPVKGLDKEGERDFPVLSFTPTASRPL